MPSIYSDILGRNAFAARPAILGAEACDHGALLRDVEKLTARLHRCGAEPNRNVATMLPHSRAYATALLACRAAGLVATPINPKAAATEIQHVLADGGAEFLIAASLPDALAKDLQAGFVDHEDGIAIYRLKPEDPYFAEGGDCLVIYTSGSTGRPKGVRLSEDAVSANVRAVADYLALSPGDRAAVFTPPAYAYAVNQTLTHLWVGAAILPWKDGLLFPAQLLQAATEASVTGVQANPTILQLLLDVDSQPIPSVRYVMSGGQPLMSSLGRRLGSLFPNARIVSMYGCTECAPRVSFKWLPAEIPDSAAPWPVGQAIAGMSIGVIRQDGEAVAVGETGEIIVTGSSLMSGYLRAPELTASRLAEGWFRTMDSGFIDADGDLTLVGRIDNIINVGHEKVAPEEVEAVIMEVLGVRGVAVGGAHDARLHRAPVALIETDESWDELVERMRAACSKGLSRVKTPRRFIRVEAIPRTPYGKIDRRGVAAMIAEVTGQAPKPAKEPFFSA